MFGQTVHFDGHAKYTITILEELDKLCQAGDPVEINADVPPGHEHILAIMKASEYITALGPNSKSRETVLNKNILCRGDTTDTSGSIGLDAFLKEMASRTEPDQRTQAQCECSACTPLLS